MSSITTSSLKFVSIGTVVSTLPRSGAVEEEEDESFCRGEEVNLAEKQHSCLVVALEILVVGCASIMGTATTPLWVNDCLLF